MTECEEVAANMSLTGFTTLAECRVKVRLEMPEESDTVVSNVTEALWARYKREWPNNPLVDRILEVTSRTWTGAMLRAVFRDPDDTIIPRFGHAASVTSDNFIICDFVGSDGQYHVGAFAGSMNEFEESVARLVAHLKLTEAEIELIQKAIAVWVVTDYRP